MTTEPRPAPPVVARELRESARRGARTLSGSLIALLAGLGALVVVAGFLLLDYKFNQDSSVLIKLVVGMPIVIFIVTQPRLGLLLLPVTAPFLAWLPQLPLPGINTLNGLLLSVFGVWAFGRILRREPIGRPTWLGPVILLMLGVMLLGLIRGAAIPTGYSYEAGPAALDLFRTATTFMPYFIALVMMRGARDRVWIMGAIAIGLVAESATTIWWGGWMKTRAMGSMAQPNVLGAFLTISTILCAAILLAQRKWWPRLLLLVAVVGGSYASILTISRSAMIALSLGFLFVSIRSSRVVTLVLLAAIVTSPAWAPATVRDRVMATTRQAEDSDDTELEGSAQARLDTWNATVAIATDHLFDGVGFDGLGYILKEQGAKMGLTHTKSSTHNTFLRVLGDLGIFGLGVYLFLLWKCWSLATAGVRAARTRFDRQIAVGLQGAVLVVLVNCWFGDRFFEFDIMCAFWMACAMVNDIVLRTHEVTA